MMTQAVCYYVSGHGLGHASRASQVMRALPAGVPLIVKTAAPEQFVRREAGRPLEFISQRFDTGTWQASNVEIDWSRTFQEALKVQHESEALLGAEVSFLRERNVGVVVADVPPLPLAAARLAGIPGIAVLNFTWMEIFRNAARQQPAVRELIRQYREHYTSASLALRTPLSFPMTYFPRMKDIPLIARRGTSCRAALEEALGIDKGKRLVLLYFGAWGTSEMQLSRLKTMTDTTFVAFTPMPEPVRYLDPDTWHFPDVLAAADVVVAKPGYGTVGECMANGTPVVYYPRAEFSEYPVLRRGMEEWGGAVRMSRTDFQSCRWSRALDAAAALRPQQVAADGAHAAAAEIMRAL